MKNSFYKVAFFIFVSSALSSLFADSFHEVQKGETLYSISRSYGLSVDAVKAANGFSGNDIKVGQKIKIPSDSAKVSENQLTGAKKTSSASQTVAKSSEKTQVTPVKNSSSTYTVQKGETWFGISRKYGVSVADLQKINGASSDSPLKVGQKIKVPASDSSAASASSSSAVASAKTPSDKGKTETKTSAPALKASDPHNYSSKKADSSLVWPVKTQNIVYINGKVGGVSMAAQKDEEVKAIRAGTVMFSGSYRGFGNVVFIQSKTGHIYAYTGLGSIDVSKGDYINYS